MRGAPCRGGRGLPTRPALPGFGGLSFLVAAQGSTSVSLPPHSFSPVCRSAPPRPSGRYPLPAAPRDPLGSWGGPFPSANNTPFSLTQIPSAKCQTSRRVCPRRTLATQRAGPVSPKPQDPPMKTRAAPRTPLPVGPARRSLWPSRGVLSVGGPQTPPSPKFSLFTVPLLFVLLRFSPTRLYLQARGQRSSKSFWSQRKK